MNNPIAFPGLGLELNIDRVAFTVFEHPIYWYGIFIALGFILAAVYCLRRSKKMGLNPDTLLDALLFAVPIGIICARLYYVIFNFSLFDGSSPNPQKFYALWEGGLAIYGGIIGAVVTAIVFARIRKIRLGSLLDVAALGLLIGQCIGRWGNFVNREAFGTATTLPWGMEITVNEINGVAIDATRMTVHPTFLYESLWTLLGFLLLHFFTKKRRFYGEIFIMYIGWYGLGRGFIEGLRTDSLMLFGTGIRVSQLLGFLTFLLATGLLVYLRVFRKDVLERPVFGELPPELEKKPSKKKVNADTVEGSAAVAAEILETEKAPAEPTGESSATDEEQAPNASDDPPGTRIESADAEE